jgi:hypothetical protein
MYRPPTKGELALRTAVLEVIEEYKPEFVFDNKNGLFVERVVRIYETLSHDLDLSWSSLEAGSENEIWAIKTAVGNALLEAHKKLVKNMAEQRVYSSIPFKIRTEISEKIVNIIRENLTKI